MDMFKLVFYFAVAFLAAVGIFIGVIMMITSLQNGSISLSYMSSGTAMNETISRVADSARFWRLFGTMGVLPVVLGAAVMWFSVRKLKGR